MWGSLGRSAARATIQTVSPKCDWPILYRWGCGASSHLMMLLVLGGTTPATL